MNMFDGAIIKKCDVEANIRPAPILVVRERRISSLKKPGLLPRQHGIGCLSEAFPGLYLNEHERLRIRDDKIDFARFRP